MGHIWSLISILLWCVHVRLHGMQKTCDVTIYIMSIFIVLYDRYDAMQWYLVTQGNRESWAKCAPSTCIARTLYLWEVEDWVKSGRVMRSVSQAHPHNHRHPDHQYSSIFGYINLYSSKFDRHALLFHRVNFSFIKFTDHIICIVVVKNQKSAATQ